MLRRGGSPWIAVVALATASFCFATTENLPIGLLQPIATGLHTSLSRVGLLVTGAGLTVAVVSVPLTRVVVGVPRRRLLSALLVVFVVLTWASAAAPDYWSLMAARLISSLAQAIFWPVASVAATAMFPARYRGRAASVVFGGGSLAIVLGVPVGTLLGQHLGWRAAFVALGCLGALSLTAVALLLPGGAPNKEEPARADHPDARRYWLIVITMVLGVTGFYTAFTYVTPFLTKVAGYSPHSIGSLLFLYGIVDFAGLVCAGTVVDRGPKWLFGGSFVILAGGLSLLFATAGSQVGAVVGLAVTALSLPALTSGQQLLVLHVAPGDLDTASAGTSAAFNVGIGGGALIGGLVLPAFGVAATALTGALFGASALGVFTLGSASVARRHAEPREAGAEPG